MTMPEICFQDLMRQIDERRVSLGITDVDDAACRNSGLRRTEAKREILREIAKRCSEAGIEPLEANY